MTTPAPVAAQAVTVTAGGRADLDVQVPPDGSAVRVGLGGDTALVLDGDGPAPPRSPKPGTTLDPLSYGGGPAGNDPE